MSEEKIITTTSEPNTINTIYQDLMRLGINNSDILLVHSSLSSLGWVCGAAQSVIIVLMKAVGSDGTLVMPAHSGEWSDPAEWGNPPVPKEWIQIIYDNMPAYEPEIAPTRGMGRIAELFRTFPNTIRSNHPHVSFCANGRVAMHIIENHPLTPQLGMDSPIGKMYNLKAKVLLLGVGYDSCTSFHLAEALINKMPIKRMGAAMLDNGERCWKWFDDYDYSSDDFILMGKEFEENYNVQKGKVGNAQCKLFEMKDGVDFAKTWLTKYR
ncbi:MAG TPA: AAC(3) family N-acetyltransferase [Ruminiclostridium sp.]